MAPLRKTIPKKAQLEIFRRDNWHCRYCHAPVFFAPTLKLLEDINPGHTYYHRNGKEGEILSLFQWGWASVDHILPVSVGGQNELNNYATACWKCNLYINDLNEGRPAPKDIVISKWDGFSGLYPQLLKSLGRKEDEWVRLLRNK